MAQDGDLLIGSPAPSAERVFDERKGWEGSGAEPPIDQMTATDYSMWNRRSNRQTLGRELDNMAGYHEVPVAAVDVPNFADPPQDGIIQP